MSFRLVLVCLLLIATSASAQVSAITIDQVMTADELRTTGVAGLTTGQRRALDKWLVKYTTVVLSVASTSSGSSGSAESGSYVGVGEGHWVKEKFDGGRVILLEDGSLWEIQAMDRMYTALWLPISQITVLDASAPIGAFRYLLINTDDGEKAFAKYLGRQ